MSMVRTTVYLDPETALAIRQLAVVRGRSQAELIRDAITRYTKRTVRPTAKGIGKYRSGEPDVAQRAKGHSRRRGQARWMALIADSGGIYGLYDASEKKHKVIRAAFEAEPGLVVIPMSILSEIDYLLRTRLGIQLNSISSTTSALAHSLWSRACRKICRGARHWSIRIATWILAWRTPV